MFRSPGSANETTEKKPISFRRLLDISILTPQELLLEVSQRPGFWNLLYIELKGDYIVLIVNVLAKVYKSLEPGEYSNPRLTRQLKTKFEKSIFINILIKYVNGLPEMRHLDKINNSLLWRNVEQFYKDVIMLCDGILFCGHHSADFLKEICCLAEVCNCTIKVVLKEAHKIHEDLISVHDEIRLVLSILSKGSDEEDSTSNDKVTDPKSFKNLNIFPNRADLLGDNKLDIQASIVNRAYLSVAHYLDLQFKLLREDCFGPLREGIKKYRRDPSKTKFDNIRVYPNVRISSTTYISNNKVGHLVDIAWNERSNQHSVDCQDFTQDKQLMLGSLLLFTNNNFGTILCGTVLDSGPNIRDKGYIAVSFQGTGLLDFTKITSSVQAVFENPYLMVESEVFFEPYHRVLKVLQNYTFYALPMERYIVHVQTETRPPAYLNARTVYKVESTVPNTKINLPLFSPYWPPASYIGLDSAQMEAYKFALTKEFVVIQGPPGTGKTFIGVKIASTLIKNVPLDGTPMIIICYTNHALDQFLEGILGVTKDVVRLGGQSKSKILEPYNLNKLKMNKKSKYSYLYRRKRTELEIIIKEMTDLQNEIEKCEKEISSLKSIKNHLKTYILNELKEKYANLMFKMVSLSKQHKKCDEALEKIRTLTDWELLKTTKVVGMTTTTAARRHDLMKKLHSPIVIVEEAAEVLEAHIVASLTFFCQHLIIIGDHKQLRPSAAHYKLAKDYNLEISLFERMIRNGVHARTLTTQRRMRPSFVELLVPEIYEQLDCHPSVHGYPNVKGMKDDLYFFSHDVFEDYMYRDGNSSHKNTLEAKWCVALANYLRKIKYESKEITILSTYTAQVSLIKEISKTYNLLHDVKVTSVDNYQGEENRIVILSLVRSNRDGRIGFLATENRVCVALSRAREGFYIFGNMKVLKSASSLWRSINQKLEAMNAIGNKLRICCPIHKNVILEVKRPHELDDCTSGLCLKICNNMALEAERPLIFVWCHVLYIIVWRFVSVRTNLTQQSQSPYNVSINTVLISIFIIYCVYWFLTF